MTDTLELCVLGADATGTAVVFARGGDDLAIGTVPIAAVAPLTAFSARLVQLSTGAHVSVTPTDLEQFGRDLFDVVIRGDVRDLYNRLPATHVRIHLLSNQPQLQALPWEFFIEPGSPLAPRLERSIVRIVPTVGAPAPSARPLGQPTRVLFVVADPSDLPDTGWTVLEASISDVFKEQIPARFTVTPVLAATEKSLLGTLQSGAFDILHFSGHGTVLKGEGHLVLTNRSRTSVFVSATKLMTYLRGRNLQLVILSACNSSAGGFDRDFSVIAKSLVQGGIPAVVANQLPVLIETVAPFCAALYRQLLLTGDIDKAVAEGRLSLFAEFADRGSRIAATNRATLEWGIPTLYRHSGASQLFTP